VPVPLEQGLAVLYRAAQNSDFVIVAISGGADSLLALNLTCEAAAAAPQTQVIGWYLHHYSSGIEPARKAVIDQAALNAQAQIPGRFTLISETADIERIHRRLRTSWEHAAAVTRRRRLRLLANRLAKKPDSTVKVVTGHNHSDLEETVSLRRARLIPDFALPRLACVDEITGFLRPLAFCSRTDVRKLAAARNIEWFDDPANNDMRFARNRLRQNGTVVPAPHREYQAEPARFLRVNAREFRIAASEFEQLNAPSRARLIFDAYRRLGITRRFTRNHFQRAQMLPFSLPPFFAHFETLNNLAYVVFRRGLAESLSLPESSQTHYVRGDKITRSTVIATPYGHKSLTKIFSERRYSPRQRRQTIVYFRSGSDKYADRVAFSAGYEK
jgi:tRNA(Ile)-lysidine synthase TilS/MesJ